jgi:hypothetical protein
VITQLRSLRHRRRIAGLVAVTAVAAASLAASSASLAAVTIGEDTTLTPTNGAGCAHADPGQVCTYAQIQHPDRSYAAPSDGVIVRWRVRGDSGRRQFTLRVLRPNGDGTFTGAGTSEPKTVVPNVENVFEARMPISQGDFIGVDVPNDDITCEPDGCTPPIRPSLAVRPVAGAISYVWSHRLQDGQTRVPTGVLANDLALLYNADIEADCDSDGFGDETQDPDTSSCPESAAETPPESQAGPKADGTLTIDANKGKVEKGRKVTLSGQLDVPSNESCEPGRQVQIQRRLKSEDDSKFATLTTVQTDATGNYSLNVKVKKTYFYRAVVAETDACDDETSNSQKVRVQKKKAAQEA